jgi:hypothetical protein
MRLVNLARVTCKIVNQGRNTNKTIDFETSLVAIDQRTGIIYLESYNCRRVDALIGMVISESLNR